ncbi:hypothetical protein [Streptomyces subrutilus]|uniref:hypothetical protein n=1 Tax=Streptomyces subrutilus TaxID=36818 RepID=UPI0014307ED8|nr:hypothetical protein [Streptomyces subrutilus]
MVALEDGPADVDDRSAVAAVVGAEDLGGDEAAEDDRGEDDELLDERSNGGSRR